MMFYEETYFKETPIGKIPKDWELEKLGNVCTKITDGTHKTPKYVNKGIPFLSTQNLIPFRKGFDSSKYEKYISREEHKELIKRCKPDKGDILVSKCGTIGRTKLVDVDYEFSIFVGVALLKLKKNSVSGEFLEQLLNYEPNRVRMEISSPGSTRKTLTINAIKKLHIPLPSLEEQKKIASILSTVDEAIQKTNEGIRKAEMLKLGLMQGLLTRGIGHTQFKPTELGEIPETWKVIELSDIVTSYKNGIYKRSEFYGRGFPSIRMHNIQDGKVNPKGAPLLEVTEKEINDYGLKQGDIVINRVNTLELVGKSGIVEENMGIATFESKNIRVRIDKGKCNPRFLTYLLNTNQCLRQIRAYAKAAVGQATINQSDLNRIKLVLPSLSEQEKIVAILLEVDKKIQHEKLLLKKFEKLKDGLMQILLSGKVRVRLN